MDRHLAGRLDFTHRPPSREPFAPGLHALGLFEDRDAMLYAPASLNLAAPVPLMTLFHGGGGSAERILPMMREHAEALGFLLLVPQSLFPTWDLVIAGNGPDRERLDLALAEVASRYLLDPWRFCFAGHSDGGSYTLSLGPANGDLVSHMIVSSAGFMSVHAQVGAPKVFIWHGTADDKIPIDGSARRHVPLLREAGYDVTYLEHDGGHPWRPEMAERAAAFFMGPPKG